MPPRIGVDAISRIEIAVPHQHCALRVAEAMTRPANSAPNPLAISAAENTMPIVVPASPTCLR